jgi:hypothetical protein
MDIYMGQNHLARCFCHSIVYDKLSGSDLFYTSFKHTTGCGCSDSSVFVDRSLYSSVQTGSDETMITR